MRPMYWRSGDQKSCLIYYATCWNAWLILTSSKFIVNDADQLKNDVESWKLRGWPGETSYA